MVEARTVEGEGGEGDVGAIRITPLCLKTQPTIIIIKISSNLPRLHPIVIKVIKKVKSTLTYLQRPAGPVPNIGKKAAELHTAPILLSASGSTW